MIKTIAILAALFALPTVAVLRPVPAKAYSCTTTCQTYGNQTSCYRSCY